MKDAVFTSMQRANDYRRGAEQRKEERWQEASKDNLENEMKRKIRTASIGALSSFENYFGYLFGFGRDSHQLTTDQRYFKDKWERCRKEVLDKSNNEIRSVPNELDKYDVSLIRSSEHILFGGNSYEE